MPLTTIIKHTCLKKRYLIISVLTSLLIFYPLISILTRNSVVSFNNKLDLYLQAEQQTQIKVKDELAPVYKDSFINKLNPTKVKLPYKLVHFDLKGAPPKLSYLKKLLKPLKASGANGILFEYEDMFPYKIHNISHTQAYKTEELKSFLKEAIRLDFEIIPLVQTFGHLEYVLKLEDYRKYREVDKYPQEICPSYDEAKQIVIELLDEVIKFHNSIKKLNYIHIGCDEIFHIGICDRCRNKEIKDLFLDHVKFVSGGLFNKYSLRSIIWDDMLRKFGDNDLGKDGIGAHVELMIWDYTENVDHLVPPYLWPMYTDAFPNIWIASAFKGAFGESLYIVEEKRHAMNQISWLKTLSRESPHIRNLRGIVLTGWSRYDHNAILCELLPVAIPSLIISLEVLNQDETALVEAAKKLKCSNDLNIDNLNIEFCSWDGVELYRSLMSLSFTEKVLKDLEIEWGNSGKGWLTDYNAKYNFTSLWRLEELKSNLLGYTENLKSLETELKERLKVYFEDFVIEEWIEERLGWIKVGLKRFIGKISGLEGRRVWGRRF